MNKRKSKLNYSSNKNGENNIQEDEVLQKK